MAKPKWTPLRVKLGQIKAWDGNPRMSTKAQAKRIIESEKRFGQPIPFLCNPLKDGIYPLLDGHQRLSAWLTVPELPYSKIEEIGARMYKGVRLSGETGEIDSAPQTNEETGGASPTVSL